MKKIIKDTIQAMRYLEHLEQFDPVTRYARMSEVAEMIPGPLDSNITDEQLAIMLIEMLITKYNSEIYAFSKAH